MVNLTRIYTRTGDDGTTRLGDISRIEQDRPAAGRLRRRRRDQRAHRRGGGAAAGCARTSSPLLRRVQNDLFDVGADLCTPLAARPRAPAAAGPERRGSTSSRPPATRYNERAGEAALVHAARRHPGGGASCTSPARSRGGPSGPPGPRSSGTAPAARRQVVNPLTAKYLNRLSDLLFILGPRREPAGSAATCCGSRAAGASSNPALATGVQPGSLGAR